MPAPVTRLAEPLKRFHKEAWHTPQGRLIREVIFGLNDGVISTIGFLAGVTATIGDLHTVALGGLAAAFAGALAMGIGAYVSSKTQRDVTPSPVGSTADQASSRRAARSPEYRAQRAEREGLREIACQ